MVRTARLLLTALTVSACGAGSGGVPAPSPAPDQGTTDLEALYRARTDSARMQFSEADVRFMTGMIGHHAQAVAMARMAPTRAGSGSIRTLAARVINAQRDEIETMQRWLRDRDQPVPEVDITSGSVGNLPEYAMDMPGMLTTAQITELETARGTEFDRLFLTFMIQHHEGAVTAVEELFATDGAARDDVVFRLASDIQVDQITEIARMEQMLEEIPERDAARDSSDASPS